MEIQAQANKDAQTRESFRSALVWGELIVCITCDVEEEEAFIFKAYDKRDESKRYSFKVSEIQRVDGEWSGQPARGY